MKKLSGFSLMEMMIVLLIISVVAAAAAPMINRQAVTTASERSPWVWVGSNHSIAYNLLGSNAQTASIGTTTPPNSASSARLYIQGSGVIPQIALGQQDSNPIKLLAGDISVYLSDRTADTDVNLSGAHTVIGYKARSSGDKANAVAIGYEAKALSSNTTVIGVGAAARNGDDSIAIGWNSQSGANDSVAVGSQAQTTGAGAVAVGSGVSAESNSIVLGYNASGTIEDVVIGTDASSTRGEGTEAQTWAASVVIGRGASAQSTDSVAIGSKAIAKGGSSIAIGSTASTPSYTQSHSAEATGTGSIAIGDGPVSIGDHSLAFGYGSLSYGVNSMAIGSDAISREDGSIAIGSATRASNDSSIALGARASALKPKSIAIGCNVMASGNHAIAIGSPSSNEVRFRTSASGEGAIAIGDGACATYPLTTAIGPGAISNVKNQITLGNENSTVLIPGNLVVRGTVLLGRKDHFVYAYNRDRDGYFKFDHKSGDHPNVPRTDQWYKKVTVDTTTYDTSGKYLSDRRLKNVGKVFAGGLAEIRKLEVFNYTFKADEAKTPRVGVIAQDLQKVFPNAVTKGDDGFLRIRMEDMFYALVNAVKDLADKFDTHDKQIADLTKQNQELQKTVTTLEKRLAELEKKVNE